MIWPEIFVVPVLVSENGVTAVSQALHLEAWSESVWFGLNGFACGLIWRVSKWRICLGKDPIVIQIHTNQSLDCFVSGLSDWGFCLDPIWKRSCFWKPESSFAAILLSWRHDLRTLYGFQGIFGLILGMWFSFTMLRSFLNSWVSDLRFLVIEEEPLGYLRRGVLEETDYIVSLYIVSILSRWEHFLNKWWLEVNELGPCSLTSLQSRMSQSQFLRKESVGSASTQGAPRLKIKVPKFDNSDLIKGYSKTLIGRCMNPPLQNMVSLLHMIPKFWHVEERVVGADLGMGKFQIDFDHEDDIAEVMKMQPFHFYGWMVSLVRWKPVMDPNYPSDITFWIKIFGVPLQFWAAEIFTSIGEFLGVLREIDIDNGRIKVTVDGFKPLFFESEMEFADGEEEIVRNVFVSAEQNPCGAEGAIEVKALSYMAALMQPQGAAPVSAQNVVFAKRALIFEDKGNMQVNEQNQGNIGNNQTGLSWHQKGKSKQGPKYGKRQGKNGKGFGYVAKEQQLLIGKTSKAHQADPIVSKDRNQLQRSLSASRVDMVSISNNGTGIENSLSHLSENEEKMLQAYAMDFQHSSEISKSIPDIPATGPFIINNLADVSLRSVSDLEIVNSPEGELLSEGKDISFLLDPIVEEGELMDSEDIYGYDNEDLLDSSEEKENGDMEALPDMGKKENKEESHILGQGKKKLIRSGAMLSEASSKKRLAQILVSPRRKTANKNAVRIGEGLYSKIEPGKKI